MVSSISYKKRTKTSLIHFLEETSAWKNHFDSVWPLTSSYFALIESDDRPVNRECPICTHSIHYMSIGMSILVALIKTISCTIFEVSPRPARKKKYKVYLWMLWQYGSWSFHAEGKKLERFLHKNQHTKRKLWNFEF